MGKAKKIGIGFGIIVAIFFAFIMIVGMSMNTTEEPLKNPELSDKEIKDFVYEISEKDPKTIYVPKLITHALVNTCNTRAIIVSYGSEQHNHNDNDTFYKKACPNMFFT